MRGVHLGLLLAATTVVVAGCSHPVEVALAPQAGAPACQAAAKAWPARIGERETVAVSVDSPTVHAWGDPAIVARCGVDEPAPSTDPCLTVNDVDWLAVPLSDGTKFVTYGRSPAIEVLVPSGAGGSAGSEGSLLPAFTDAANALRHTGRHCS